MKDIGYVSLLCVLFLVLGVFSGSLLFPRVNEVEIEVEVPGEIVYQNISVPAEEIEVQYDFLGVAVDEFLEAVEDEEDEAGNEIDVLGNYDFDEMKLRNVEDEWSLVYEDDDKYSVSFEIDLKFKEEGERSEVKSYNVEVFYEDGEDTEIEYSLI